MLLLPIALPFLGGFFLFLFGKQGSPLAKNPQALLYPILAVTSLLVLAMPFVGPEDLVFGNFPFDVVFALYMDEISCFFSLLFVIIWCSVLPYALDYLAHDENKIRFFVAFLSLLGAMLGLCYAYNLVTFYLFFEMVSLCSVFLVAHEQTESALEAGKKFFYYSMAGAFIAMVSVIYFYSLKSVTPIAADVWMKFTPGGIPAVLENGENHSILAYTLLAVIGLGCKAGMFPLHGWLKTAHPIAPAPASAVLSAVTTKAGILGILRILYYVVGAETLRGTYVQTWGLWLSALTIFMGSMLAYRENVLKTRLAYSTVSQVSYVIFALFLFDTFGLVGALLQVVFHGLSKTLLFLCAGTFIHEGKVTQIDQLKGIGLRLPTTLGLFTLASLSLVGLPFTGGFVSKCYIAFGAVALGRPLPSFGVFVIILSAILTAGYLIPVAVLGFFPDPEDREVVHDLPSIHPFPKEPSTYGLGILLIALGIYSQSLIAFCLTIAEAVGLGGIL